MSKTDEHRNAAGFLSVDKVLALGNRHNVILDPYSLLIGEQVTIGNGNTFYPNVVLACTKPGKIIIGNGNTFYPGVYVLASDGSITVGDNNDFGSGGCTIKANVSGAAITIGSNGRYLDGASIMGTCALGNGCQILGAITVQNCVLEGGKAFTEPNPDTRGAVLKGFGLARNLKLTKGQVVNGAGNFNDAPIEWQHDYHKPSA